MCGAMGPSGLNVDPSKFLASGVSEENMERSRITVSSRWPVLVQMLMEGTHTDITFEARGGSVVQAHRCILATVSPVFSSMFKYGTISTVDFTSMSIETLQLFVLLVYISCEKSMNPVMLELREAVGRRFLPLYDAANNCQVVDRLSAVFEYALARNLSPGNCWDLYRKSTNWELQEMCHEYILRNFKEVSASESVLVEMEWNPELVQSFMVLAAGRSACDKCGCTAE